MTSVDRSCLGRSLRLVAVPMGRGLSICIFGGDLPHLGGAAFAWIDDRNGASGATASASAPGHREAELAEEIATLVRDKRGANVAVACGIHYEGASREDIRVICQAVREMAMDIADAV